MKNVFISEIICRLRDKPSTKLTKFIYSEGYLSNDIVHLNKIICELRLKKLLYILGITLLYPHLNRPKKEDEDTKGTCKTRRGRVNENVLAKTLDNERATKYYV